MICALMIGRANSVTLPGKNIYPILGRKMCEYPLIAHQNQNILTEFLCQQIAQLYLK